MDHLNIPNNLLNSVGTSQQNSANTSDAEMNFEISENNNPAKKQKLSSSPNSYTSSPNSTPSESAPKLAPFIHKMELLIKNNQNVFWSEDGKFMVIDGIRSDDFSSELEKVGLSNKHESFIRQMNTYGFRKEEYHPVENKNRIKYPNQVFAYFNKNFTRDFKDLHAVHSTGKRKPIQQERETVSQLQKQTTNQHSLIKNLESQIANERMRSQKLQDLVLQIAGDSRVDSSLQNEIYRILAQNSNNSEITPNFTPPMSVSPQIPQNLAQTLTNQNLQEQHNFQVQHQNQALHNLHLQTQIQNLVNNQLLGNNLLNQPLNISIPDSSVSMQPQRVQSTEENQNIQVTENNIPMQRVLTQNDLNLQKLTLFLASQQNKTNHL